MATLRQQLATNMLRLTRYRELLNAVRAYNGSGPAADRYAQTVLARADSYAGRLGLPRP